MSNTGLTACCGLDCTACPAYLSTKNNDDALREKTAKEWSQMYNASLTAADIDCNGCTLPGKKFSHRLECEIRGCATGKKLATCASCSEYACERLKSFFTFVPDAKAKLDSLRSAGR